MKTEYTLTRHAYERYVQRVGKGRTKSDALHWLVQAISNSTFIGESDSYRYYKYADFKIVVGEKNKIITISYFNDSNVKDFKKEMNSFIRTKFKNKLKPLYRMKRCLQIEVYEAKIKQLKVNNPTTKAIIQNEISDLESQLVRTIGSIDNIIKLASNYNIPSNDLTKE